MKRITRQKDGNSSFLFLRLFLAGAYAEKIISFPSFPQTKTPDCLQYSSPAFLVDLTVRKTLNSFLTQTFFTIVKRWIEVVSFSLNVLEIRRQRSRRFDESIYTRPIRALRPRARPCGKPRADALRRRSRPAQISDSRLPYAP